LWLETLTTAEANANLPANEKPKMSLMKFLLTFLILLSGSQAYASSVTFTPVRLSHVCHRFEGTRYWDCHHTEMIFSPVTVELKDDSWPGQKSGEWSLVKDGHAFLVRIVYLPGVRGGGEYSIEVYAGSLEAFNQKNYDEMALGSARFSADSLANRISVLARLISEDPDRRVNYGLAVDGLSVRR